MLIAGILTIGLAYIRDGKRIFSIFTEPKDIGKLLVFGILGIALAQYSYFKSIAISGVGIATVLQNVAPTLIIIYLFLRYFKKPSVPEFFCIVLALVGILCIVMQEGLDVLNFNVLALFWGLVSAASICVYTLQPIDLLKKYGTTSIVGFARESFYAGRYFWHDLYHCNRIHYSLGATPSNQTRSTKKIK